MYTRTSFMVLLLLTLSGCASMGRSNTRRATMVWRNALTARESDGIIHRTPGKYSIYCPEPVGPAAKNNKTTIMVKEPTTGAEGQVINEQSVGKVYDMSNVVQFSQYALFMNCVGWANGTIDSKDYADTMRVILKQTEGLIKAQIGAEEKAEHDFAAQSVVEQLEKVEEAEELLKSAKATRGEDSSDVKKKEEELTIEKAVLKALTENLEETAK